LCLLASALLSSFDNPSQEESDKLWEEEIGRRIKAFKQGKTKTVPVSKAAAAARTRLKV